MKSDFFSLGSSSGDWLIHAFRKFTGKDPARKAFDVKLKEISDAIAAEKPEQVTQLLKDAKDFGMLTPRDYDTMLFNALLTDNVPTFKAVLDARGEPNALMCVEISPTRTGYMHVLYAAIDFGKETIAKDLSNRADIEYTDSGFLVMGAENERQEKYPLPAAAAQAKNMTAVAETLRARTEMDNFSITRLARSLMKA